MSRMPFTRRMEILAGHGSRYGSIVSDENMAKLM